MSFISTMLRLRSPRFVAPKLTKYCTKFRGLSVTPLNSGQIRSDDPNMTVFDRNTKSLQRERAACATDVNVYDYLKDEIGWRLADRVFDIKRKFKVAADIAPDVCCTLWHPRHGNTATQVFGTCDSRDTDAAAFNNNPHVSNIGCYDSEIFEPNSLDLVISSLSLHWVNDLPGAFKRILQSLKEDGVLLAAVFGGDTLYELRSSLQLAELERRGGISPHISPFTEVRDIGTLLTKAGFTMLTIDTDEIVVSYPTMFELMWDLKGMAESNAALNRSLHLHRETQFAAAAIYQQLYGKIDPETGKTTLPATFQIINMLGWKPHPNQPKPLERGSGEVSLKDLYKLDEIIKEIKTVKNDDETNK